MKDSKGKCPAKRDALKPVDQRKVGKKKARAKDPNKPKRPATPFFVFMENFRVKFKRENPYVKNVSAYAKAGGEKWRSMSAAEKAPYEANAAKRKIYYEKLIKEYNKKKQEHEVDDVKEDSDKSTSEDGSDKSTSEDDSDESSSEESEESVQILDDDSDVVILEPKQKRREPLVENVCHVSDSVENPSSSQSDIISVKGYNVKRSNATILEAIFKNHGDIAAKCVFRTDSMRASILEVVCEVVRCIQTNSVIDKMEELECRVLDAEEAYVDVTWLRAHLEAIGKRKETSKKYSRLMKMKENTSMLKKVVHVDWREKCSEHVAAKQRLEKAEKCMKVLQIIEENLNENMLESKDKLDSWVNHQVV